MLHRQVQPFLLRAYPEHLFCSVKYTMKIEALFVQSDASRLYLGYFQNFVNQTQQMLAAAANDSNVLFVFLR